LQKITWRSDDMLIVRGVNLFPTQVEEQIRKVKGLDARQAAADELGHHITGQIGLTAKITVTDPGGVERSQGKARRVIDKRGKD
jgi:phenylacetate-CoA ligase